MPEPQGYVDPTPPAQPVDGPALKPAPEIFAAIDTSYLRKMRNDLNTVIPGDATWASAVSRALQHLLSADLFHPDRIARDKADEEKRQAILKTAAAAAMKLRHEQEQAALPRLPDGKLEPHAKDLLDKKHAAEIEAVAAEEKRAALATQQAKERAEFEQKQREAQATLAAKDAPRPARDPLTGAEAQADHGPGGIFTPPLRTEPPPNEFRPNPQL
jgi:hypothetical protein